MNSGPLTSFLDKQTGGEIISETAMQDNKFCPQKPLESATESVVLPYWQFIRFLYGAFFPFRTAEKEFLRLYPTHMK